MNHVKYWIHTSQILVREPFFSGAQQALALLTKIVLRKTIVSKALVKRRMIVDSLLTIINYHQLSSTIIHKAKLPKKFLTVDDSSPAVVRVVSFRRFLCKNVNTNMASRETNL